MIVIDGYFIDVAVSIDPTLTNEVTSHPVESGSEVSDHVRARPVTLTIEGIVSDTPIGEIVAKRGDGLGGGLLPSDEAYWTLIQINNDRNPVTIDTLGILGEFENMVLVSLSTPQRAGTGDALRFTASFTQVRVVESARDTVPVAVPLAKRKVNKAAAQPSRLPYLTTARASGTNRPRRTKKTTAQSSR